MTRGRPRRRIWTVLATVLGVGFVCLLLGYSRSTHALCSKCGAEWEVVERGAGVPEGRHMRFVRSARLVEEPPPAVRRFLEPDHVHDQDGRAGGWSSFGPFGFGALSCRHESDRGGFADALWTEPAFGDYLAARVADGTTDVETVRALIAESPHANGESPSATIRRQGRELYFAFHGPDPGRDDVWHYVDPACPRVPVRIPDR